MMKLNKMQNNNNFQPNFKIILKHNHLKIFNKINNLLNKIH